MVRWSGGQVVRCHARARGAGSAEMRARAVLVHTRVHGHMHLHMQVCTWHLRVEWSAAEGRYRGDLGEI